MLQNPGVANYIGCVGKLLTKFDPKIWYLKKFVSRYLRILNLGNDEYGKKLKEAAENGGVKTHYLVDSTTPTGTCAVLVTDKER